MIKYNAQGLVSVIVQQYDSKQVLMLAWMNEEALSQTITTKEMCYWSRSRSELWVKGATSGNRQKLIELRLDCDSDAILALVDQTGAACHTGADSCFFSELLV